MAKKNMGSVSQTPTTAPAHQMSAIEMQDWYVRYGKTIENFKAAEDAVKTIQDVTKTATKSITAFDKETIRTYLQNIGSNEKNLRNLSRYLYYRSQPYYRLIMYNANMFCLDARVVVPNYDIIQVPDVQSTLSSYNDTLHMLNKMNLQYEMKKAYARCFREDVFYGAAYYDDTGFFILPLPADYCKISGIYSMNGDFSFVMDMSYFRSNQTLLELWGEPFTSMYNDYGNNNANKWQKMPDEYAICFKARAEDWDTVVPPYSGILNSIVSLIDMEDIQAVADEQQIYKLIWLEMETITGSNSANDWKISPDIITKYFNKMINDALPDYMSAAIVPGKLDTISFNNDQSTDVNKIANATATVLNTSGGAQILNSGTISGTTAFTAAVKSDSLQAISFLLPQTQAWLNRFLTYYISNPSNVKFFNVSEYTKSEVKESLLKSAQYGLPGKMAIMSFDGLSELDTLSLNYLEETCLGFTNKLHPLPSSSTQSSSDSDNEAGAPTKSATEITDDGEASRDKADTAKG